MTAVPAIIASKTAEDAQRAAAGFLARYGGPPVGRMAVTCAPGSRGAGRAASRCSRPRAPTSSCGSEGWNTSACRPHGLAPAQHGGSYHRFAVIDGYIDRTPTEFVPRPQRDTESTTLGLYRMELGAFIAQGAAAGVTDHAVACLLGLDGVRVSEACNINIEDLGLERGHRTLYIIGKGNKPALIPLPPRVARAVDHAASGRLDGPLLLGQTGRRLDRFGATRIVRRLAKRAGISKRISPHSLRHSFITAALDAASRSKTSRSPLATPTTERRLARTGHATTSTATPPTS